MQIPGKLNVRSTAATGAPLRARIDGVFGNAQDLQNTAFFSSLLVFCPADNFTQALEFSEDRFGGGSPFERMRMLIPVGDEALDLAAQIGDRGEGAAADRALSDQAEPTLDLVQPGGIRGCVMQMKTRMTRKPGFDSGVFMVAVVIDNHVHV
jgi:hypothetical protein